MRLEVASIEIEDVQFSKRTRLEGGTLYLNTDELRGILMEGDHFADVSFYVARPGDKTRIIHVVDAVEPRCKLDDHSTFPGFIGLSRTVGEGKTRRLSGMSIVSITSSVAGEAVHSSEAIIDMTGPASELSPLGSVINLVVDYKPHPNYLRYDSPEGQAVDVLSGSLLAQAYNRQIRTASLKAAAYLAKSTASNEDEDLKAYELTSTDPTLPRVAYLIQGRPWIYGAQFDRYLPTLMHPNEFLDGALVCRRREQGSSRDVTYFYQNPSIIQTLYQHHGTDLNFVGVVLLPVTPFDIEAKERVAEYACKLVRMLGANGVCASSSGGGNPIVEFMLFCQKCEQAGIKTVQADPESIGSPNDPGFVFYVPEAKAIISTGRITEEVQLPAMSKVIGGDKFFDSPLPPAGSVSVPYRYILGCTSNIGASRLTAREH